MKTIIFVIGPPNSGKSFFINKYLSDYKVIDLRDFQLKYKYVSYNDIVESYKECEKELRKACLKYDKIVLEHTLMVRKRRPQYINAVKESLNNQDYKLKCYYSLPSLEDYKKYDLKDYNDYIKNNKCYMGNPMNDEQLEEYLNFFEIPELNDGFDEIKCIQDFS